ncbi:MAG TPA: glycogen debranching N-terminal domain-containing protein, partial [Gemmatimonadales bacterium]|nr:glycogen debranching N-terminal domain-containing protein [Gemmatimonadales bacterium]
MAQRAVNPHGSWITFAGYSVVVAPPDGSFVGDGRDGLFDFDTRILSRHRILVNGEPPEFVGGGLLAADRSVAHLTSPPPGGDRAGPLLPQDLLELVLVRRVGCGLREWLSLTNHSMADADIELIVELDADFADVLDIGRHIEGERTVRWTPVDRSLEIRFAARQAERVLERGLRVHVAAADSAPEFAHGQFRFRFALPASGRWRADLVYASLVDGRWRD